MYWLFNRLFFPAPSFGGPYPRPKYTWAKVRICYETEKAILVLYDNSKLWIPKSRIKKVKLKNQSFYFYLPELNLQ